MTGDSSALGSVALGLASGASWGAGDFSGGLATRQAPALTVVAVSQVVGIAFLVALSLATGETLPGPRQLGWAALAGASGACGLLALYSALASGRMGIAAPLSGVAGAVVPVLAGSAMQGSPGALRLAGFALALAGVWLLAAVDDGAGRANLRALALPLLSGVGLGLFLVLIHRAGGGATVLWPLAVARAASISMLAAVGLATGKLVRPSPSALPFIALAGLLDTGGNALFLLATHVGRFDVAAVLSSLYPASTVILACVFLGERLTARQTAGAVAVLASIACVS